jgi:hypothetical protein
MWYYLPINPDPWAIGPLQIGKRNGKFFPNIGPNRQLVAFKEAVAEELTRQGATMLPPGEYEIRLFFYRRLDGNSRNRKHVADATNMQKATEDAFQSVLIDNDRGVVDIRSRVVEQSVETEPGIFAYVGPADPFDPSEIPDEMWDVRDQSEGPTLFDNTWPPS